MATTRKAPLAARIQEWPEMLRMLREMKNPLRRILLTGPAGTGKTTYALSLSPEGERFTCAEGQFADALTGKFLLVNGSTVFHEAAPVRAMRRGVPLVLDELHLAAPETNSTLQALLDDESVCSLNLDNGETVKPQQGFCVIATMNGSVEQIKYEVLDRFDLVLKCKTPHSGLLKRLSPDSAAFLRNKMLNEPDNDTWVPTISPRRFIAFEHLRKEGIDEALAADLVFGVGQGAAILTGMIDAQRNAINSGESFAGNVEVE